MKMTYYPQIEEHELEQLNASRSVIAEVSQYGTRYYHTACLRKYKAQQEMVAYAKMPGRAVMGTYQVRRGSCCALCKLTINA